MKDEIKNFIGDGTKTLKEIYDAFPDKKKNSLRGCVNMMVKEGKLERVAVATYKVKEV